MRTVLSVRGQTVVPAAIRAQLGIKPGAQLEWSVADGVIVVRPLPPDPIQASVGFLKPFGVSVADLLAERAAERGRDA